MITRFIKFCKFIRQWGGDNDKELHLAIIIILVAIISFGLGRLSKIREEKTPITIENVATSTETVVNTSSQPARLSQPGRLTADAEKIFVASKNGKKYYYAWCDSAQKIKESNRVWFSTKEEAEKAGYEPAANCKGLK